VGDESPAAALARIAELTRRRKALVVIASDLFDADDHTLTALAQLRAQRHDVTVLHVLDPHERAFPYDGLTQFESLETAHKMLVNPAAIRREYTDRMDAFLARWGDGWVERRTEEGEEQVRLRMLGEFRQPIPSRAARNRRLHVRAVNQRPAFLLIVPCGGRATPGESGREFLY